MSGPFSGLIAATHTPFDARGQLNLEVIAPYAEHLVTQRVSGAFICGYTGEGYSLTREEREALAARWCEAAAGRLPVIVHVGSLCLPDSQALAAHAQQVGARAVATAPPFYYRPMRGPDVLAWLAEIAAAAPGLPLYYYHAPTVTGVDLDVAALLAEGAACVPTLAGVKYTSQDLAGFAQCLRVEPARYTMLYGCDEMLLSALALGAAGAVGSTYNYAAPIYHRVMDAFQAGDITTAREWQQRSVALVARLARDAFMPASKTVLALLGIDCGQPRRPLPSFDAAARAELRDDLEALGFFRDVAP